MKTYSEKKSIWPQKQGLDWQVYKKCLPTPKAGIGKERVFPIAIGNHNQPLNFRLPASRTARPHISIVSGHLVWGALYDNPKKLRQCLMHWSFSKQMFLLCTENRDNGSISDHEIVAVEVVAVVVSVVVVVIAIIYKTYTTLFWVRYYIDNLIYFYCKETKSHVKEVFQNYRVGKCQGQEFSPQFSLLTIAHSLSLPPN